MSRESSMSHSSKPLPVFAKLAVMLRKIPAVQFVVAKFAALRSNKGSGEPVITKFLGEAPGVTRNTVDQDHTVSKLSNDHAIAAPESNGRSEREKLIRQRWLETGIKIWNPDVHGAGHAALNIQGRAELLPVKPGERLPGYDKLEFKLIGGHIVCEGVVVDPPRSDRKPGAAHGPVCVAD
jgi:hypothetical protein